MTFNFNLCEKVQQIETISEIKCTIVELGTNGYAYKILLNLRFRKHWRKGSAGRPEETDIQKVCHLIVSSGNITSHTHKFRATCEPKCELNKDDSDSAKLERENFMTSQTYTKKCREPRRWGTKRVTFLRGEHTNSLPTDQ